MKKKSLAVLAPVFIICLHCSAQLKGFGIGPYAEMAWPAGNFKGSNKNGLGIGLAGDIRPGKLGLTGSIGYMRFGGKIVNTGDGVINMPAINAMPVRAGLKYRLAPMIYTKLEAGVANYSNSEGSAFILSPGIGLRLLGLDVQLKYETWIKDGNKSFWGLRAGYFF